jgi:GDPmannose 4,6-dehydratase
MKKALITGITGQDGSFLSQFLLNKGYEVHGIRRRSSSFNTGRIDHLYKDPHTAQSNFFLHYADLTDSNSISQVVTKVQPDEIYHLGAQSHVALSFENPEYTANVNALGTLRILEAIRMSGKDCRFYHAATSEMFGNSPHPQNENTLLAPESPYGTSKLFGYWITRNYREAYGMHATNGILFNHESPVRGETFVTRKIVRGLCSISKGNTEPLYLGNLEAMRDWGYAGEYVELMWEMLQMPSGDDFVVGTGRSVSVRKFVEMVANELAIPLSWSGSDKNEVGIRTDTGATIIRIDPEYYRPNEVNYLLADAEKAFKTFNWKPKITVEKLVKIMVSAELN